MNEAANFRRKAFVAAAANAFFSNGFGDTTMSSIASAVGGSKTTLWAYFPSKEELFAAVVDDIIERHGEALSVNLPEDEEIEVILRRFGKVLLATLLSEPVLDLHRLVIGEAKRFPHLARLFYERGPRRGESRLAVYFALAMENGILRAGDAEAATNQFAALCQSGRYQQALLNFEIDATQDRRDADIDLAVETFCRAWVIKL